MGANIHLFIKKDYSLDATTRTAKGEAMTDKPKAISPKEALEAAAEAFNIPLHDHRKRLSEGFVCHCDRCVQKLAKAAIPIAELEGQAVEALTNMIQAGSITVDYVNAKEDAVKVLTKLAALKAKGK